MISNQNLEQHEKKVTWKKSFEEFGIKKSKRIDVKHLHTHTAESKNSTQRNKKKRAKPKTKWKHARTSPHRISSEQIFLFKKERIKKIWRRCLKCNFFFTSCDLFRCFCSCWTVVLRALYSIFFSVCTCQKTKMTATTKNYRHTYTHHFILHL